eukprot:scaffold4809_cov116-Cylindrotheca_fusiformis.AAC.16
MMDERRFARHKKRVPKIRAVFLAVRGLCPRKQPESRPGRAIFRVHKLEKEPPKHDETFSRLQWRVILPASTGRSRVTVFDEGHVVSNLARCLYYTTQLGDRKGSQVYFISGRNGQLSRFFSSCIHRGEEGRTGAFRKCGLTKNVNIEVLVTARNRATIAHLDDLLKTNSKAVSFKRQELTLPRWQPMMASHY